MFACASSFLAMIITDYNDTNGKSNMYHSLIHNIHVLQTLLETIIVNIYAHTVQIGTQINATYNLNSLLYSTYK